MSASICRQSGAGSGPVAARGGGVATPDIAHHQLESPDEHATLILPSDTASQGGLKTDIMTVRQRAEAAEQAAADARAAAADATARHDRAVLIERQRGEAALAAAEEMLRKQADDLVRQHQAALQDERARSAAALEAAVAPVRERLTAAKKAHEAELAAERENRGAAVEAATAPLRQRVAALHEASTKAAALVRTMQRSQPAEPAGTAAVYPYQHPYQGDAPLRLTLQATEMYRRVYYAAMGLTREQRLAAGMLGCLALQLVLIWLIRRYLEVPPEVRCPD